MFADQIGRPTLACALTDWRDVLTDAPVPRNILGVLTNSVPRDVLTDALVSTDALILTNVPVPRAGGHLSLLLTLSPASLPIS